jgi:competence protein ComEC
MPVNTNGNLWVYCINVGQGDTTVILTPSNRVILIDAFKEKKVIDLLDNLGFDAEDDTIEHIIATHPHNDHYGGVERLLTTYHVENLTLSSLWRFTDSTPGYNSMINTAVARDVNLDFLSGYTQIFPDANPVADPNALRIECLGPSNQFLENLFQSGDLNTNHRSIISRLQLGDFRMIIAADAQLENWALFDSEQMLNSPCTVLRSAHHGSANGTQYERLTRLAPRMVIVSSDPDGKDELPDLIGCAALLRYASDSSDPLVVLTFDSGTIKLEVTPSGNRSAFRYGEGNSSSDFIPLANKQVLDNASNPSNWRALLNQKLPP